MIILILAGISVGAVEPITLQSLLTEMTDLEALARFPAANYQSLQASSYNRASTHRDQPDRGTSGWFADSDGLGFIRTEIIDGHQEWVIMDHQGPGCLTRIWTPFFYYDLQDRVGPNVRIYLDDSSTPVIDESLIQLVRGDGIFPAPLAVKTARAGDCYVPIPFARSCKVTLTKKSFYNIINYRAYPPGTPVETFTREAYHAAKRQYDAAGARLSALPHPDRGDLQKHATLRTGRKLVVTLPKGPHALRQFTVRLPGAIENPSSLRSTVLSMTYDGVETVWTPVGDFFGSADALHSFRTYQRVVMEDGVLVCRWVMPYRRSAEVRVTNLGPTPVPLTVQAEVMPWIWDERSMHFYARWRPDELVPGAPFQDWNFVDIRGQGVYVGDQWTVLNPQEGWWGEGDEKIYVDGAWDQGFPTHFGTGTEDYYGWAGGVNPTRQDEFSTPFLANVRVGGLNEDTKGFNICVRHRGLDAIPFRQRLVFDMESSFGVDIRHPWDLLGYSAVTFWYAKPGATHNRPALPNEARKPIVSMELAVQRAEEIGGGKGRGGRGK
ncbi:MAG: DUF2961 domain-containing protein [Verrucomicrobiales bacterium]|nr:DUF2961 domain-containing protein [Verrucomicrobiales bacterium]